MSSTSTTWTKDTNTKSGTVNISEQTVSSIRITATADNDAILELFADNANDNADKWRLWINDADDDLHFANYTSGSWADLLTIQDGGNVGIATDGPASKLHVAGTVQVGVDDSGHDVKFFGASAGAFMLYDESEDTLEVRGTSADATTSTGKLLLSTALTDINDGDVLGRIDFGAPLEAGGTDAILSGAAIWAEADATFTASVNNTELVFATNTSAAATERMRIDSSGNVGIGTTEPGAELDIKQSADNTDFLQGRDANGDIVFRCATDADGDGVVYIENSASAEKIRLYSNGASYFNGGNVGIGTVSPDVALHITKTGTGGVLRLENSDTTITADEVLGQIEFEGQDSSTNAAGVRAKIAAFGSTGGITGETDIAFYTSIAGDNLSEKMRIQDDGNVGIGVTAPESTLHIKGNLGLIIEDDTDASGLGEAWHFQTDSTGQLNAQYSTNCSTFNTLWTCEANGNFGIGTASPTELFHVNEADTTAEAGVIHRLSTTSGAALKIGVDDKSASAPTWIIETGTNEHLHLNATGTGNVGIGTSSPDFPLEIEGEDTSINLAITCYSATVTHRPQLIFQKSAGSTPGSPAATAAGEDLGAIVWEGVNTGNNFDVGAKILVEGDAGPDGNSVPTRMSFWTSDLSSPEQKRMTIDDSGNVGIGTAGPNYTLDVVGSPSSNYVARIFSDGGASTDYGLIIQAGADTPGTDGDCRWIALAEGDAGTVHAHIRYKHTGTTAEIHAVSDERLKENIQNTSVNGLDAINSLQFREYNWTENSKRSQNKINIGLVAQEVTTAGDKCNIVSKFEDEITLKDDSKITDVQGIGYDGILLYLAKAVQELSASVDILSTKVTALENA